ncbi:hypothetical protein B5K06_34195 [Rhizobium grahamii]|uniref:Uncharacterized protein n=1 Tax=Rhizobium grahamii TaxID=1120045 RepID=A0A370KDZ6_9HYPH|nr:hypothetical protein B5K06_34195 [Rhizobium grahamii]
MFSLLSRLERVGFHKVCQRIAALIGLRPSVPARQGSKGDRGAEIPARHWAAWARAADEAKNLLKEKRPSQACSSAPGTQESIRGS